MAAIELGIKAQNLAIRLPRGGDFVSALIGSEPWDPDTEIFLEFRSDDLVDDPDYVWNTTISGARADWNIPRESVDEVIEDRSWAVRLIYAAGGARLVWAKGNARVD